MTIRDEFDTYDMSNAGQARAFDIAMVFTEALDAIEKIVGKEGRDMAIVRTKLEEACFFAKRANSRKPESQQGT